MIIEELESVVAPLDYSDYAVLFLTGVALGMTLC